ncbi:MAG TPA: transcriptional regulator [Streptosporangiaceae bacterium]|nr:transcriptional regulator [Streptosporangiaceae bacterium]
MSEAEDFGGADAVSGETVPGHPALGLDEVVHQRNRLGILAVLAEAGQADFPYLRSLLGLTDGNLGRHLQVLEEAGLIMITKGYHRRRPRTVASITPDGRHALNAELASLRKLMTRLEEPASSNGDAPA